jgi:predicted AAA+ superfamily ATPase
MNYIPRFIEKDLELMFANFPVLAIVGPRQAGKSTLVKHMLSQNPKAIYLDLERPSDLSKLIDPELFLSAHKGKTICIDEVQRLPEIFPLIRSLVDEWAYNGAFILLGSASRDLLRQSSESLAGRIIYKNLTPFLLNELGDLKSQQDYWLKGGFPKSILAINDEISFVWRESFITTFLERDILQWSNFTPTLMKRLWLMIAHINGQTINYSSLASSLGISSVTVKNYIDLLEATFMIEVLPPYYSNLGKRLTKAPKIYIADSGITTALLQIRNYDSLIGHPVFGSIWEQIVLSNLKGCFQGAEFFHYRTSNGAEIDLVMKYRGKTFAIESKATLSPVLSSGNYFAVEDIKPDAFFVAAPVEQSWFMKKDTEVLSVLQLVDRIRCIV